MTTGLYTYRTGYSYLKYLEEQSHFDDLKLFIAKQNRASVASSAALQNEMSLLVSSVQDGNEQIVARLDAAISNLANLGAIFEHGFANIDARLDGIERSLQELTRLTANRDQTWANEQFRIAGDAYTRGLHREALDYASRAIEGHGPEPGYPLEANYHLLRGTVRVGDKRNFDRKVVDFEGAISDFLSALRYSDGDQKSSRANQKLAWVSYCLGRFDDAVRFARAVSMHQGRVAEEAKFIEAKATSRLGNCDQAVHLVCRLGDINCLYFMRAFADADFEPVYSRIKAEVDNRRANLLTVLTDRSTKARQIIQADPEIADKHLISKIASSLPEQLAHDAALKDMLDLDVRTKDILKNMSDRIDGVIRSLKSNRNSIDEKFKSTLKSGYRFNYYGWAWGVGLAIAGIYVYFGIQMPSIGAGALITGPILGVIGGWIGSGIIGLVGYILHQSAVRGQHSIENSEPGADLARLENLKKHVDAVGANLPKIASW
jgi:tetratricopeptide (TPR) repeat protein